MLSVHIDGEHAYDVDAPADILADLQAEADAIGLDPAKLAKIERACARLEQGESEADLFGDGTVIVAWYPAQTTETPASCGASRTCGADQTDCFGCLVTCDKPAGHDGFHNDSDARYHWPMEGERL